MKGQRSSGRFQWDGMTRSKRPRLRCAELLTCAVGLLTDEEVCCLSRDDLLFVLHTVQERTPELADEIRGENQSDGELLRLLLHLRLAIRKLMNQQSYLDGYAPVFDDVFAKPGDLPRVQRQGRSVAAEDGAPGALRDNPG